MIWTIISTCPLWPILVGIWASERKARKARKPDIWEWSFKPPKSCLVPKQYGYGRLGISIEQWSKMGERDRWDDEGRLVNPDKAFIMEQLALIEEIDQENQFWYEFDKSGGLG